jgi:hypothetical protein
MERKIDKASKAGDGKFIGYGDDSVVTGCTVVDSRVATVLSDETSVPDGTVGVSSTRLLLLEAVSSSGDKDIS